MRKEVQSLYSACESIFALDKLKLSESYYYDSLPLCVIDAVFSMGVRYTSTQNVVKNYCSYFSLREYNLSSDERADQHNITQLIQNIKMAGVERSADWIFKNHQRTSSRSGILKAEAVLRFAEILKKYRIETRRDFAERGLPEQTEEEIKCIPGQRSGLALHYFYMLAGDDNWAKPDRHVLRFIKMYIGSTVSAAEALNLLRELAAELKNTYPNITVRLLDYAIWDYMAHDRPNVKADDKSHKGLEKFQQAVADKIKQLYKIAGELEEIFPGRHYTPDGHMLGSIGEALAAYYYDLELFPASEETHDAKAKDGRLVQIKATQIDRVALSSEPEWLLVLKIHKDGSFVEAYNGPGNLAWANCGNLQKNGQQVISLARLAKLQAEVLQADRLQRAP